MPDPNTIEVPAAGSCHMSNGLPDHTCTPGLLNPDLTPARLCAPNFSTKTIRPPVAYTDVLKRRLMASYGLTDSPANYELDHLVSLEDLGHPWSPKNLWPMPRGKSLPGGQPTGVTVNTAEDKDQIETAVHRGICATPNDPAHIADLQFRLATDWTQLKQSPTAFGLDPNAAPPKEETEP